MPLPSNCTLCNASNEHQSVITPHVYGDSDSHYAFYRCEVCEVIYLYPQLTDKQESLFYAKEFESFMDNRSGEKAGWKTPEDHIRANQTQFERRWKYLKNLLPQNGKILEFGCSSGFMLFPLIDKGYFCSGIEPSGYFSEYVKSKGITIYKDLNEIADRFNIVMHYFVLEHVRHPLGFINDNLRLLKPNGQLIIEIPNSADPLHTVYEIPEFEKFYWSIAHHWYFNEKSVSYILNQIDNISFEVIREQRYDLSNHMTWARDGRPGGMNRFTDKIGSNIEEVYKKALVESGYSDTLVLVIRKTN